MILVTGASGILGRKIIETLSHKGHKVKAQKRASSKIDGLNSLMGDSNIEWIDCDILDFVAMEKAFENVTHVVHCAAVVSFHLPDGVRHPGRL